MKLKERLADGEILVLDGAIGTELEARGIPEAHDASWGECLGTHPEIVQQVHESYVLAGADIITTNTYSSGPNVLRRLGHTDKVEEWNQRAVQLASNAREISENDRAIYIAGSVSAFGNGAMRYNGSCDGIYWGEDDLEQVKKNFQEHISILVDAGVDLIMLELLCAEKRDIEMALEVVETFNIPYYVALSATADDSGELSLQSTDGTNGQSDANKLSDIIQAIKGKGFSALLTHHVEIDLVERVLTEMRANWEGPIGIYPNRTGHWDGKKWVFVEEVNPENYAKLARRWSNNGAQIIGGCCGVGPDHIQAVRKEFK